MRTHRRFIVALAALLALLGREATSRATVPVEREDFGRANVPVERDGFSRAIARVTVTPSRAQAQTPDAGDVAEGMRLYLQKGDCQACHGWAADGRKMDSQMPDGSNLRETRLDRARLVTTIKCGRPGTGMPAFDKFAYSDGRCYGMKQADLKSPMPDPPATFQQREIDLVVDFLMAKVVGKGPMDRAKCIAYWGSDVDACREYK